MNPLEWIRSNPLLSTLITLKLLIHLFTNMNYGFHRDEFLYLELGQHLSWGYLEVPPFIALIGSIAMFLGGDIQIVRFFPALAGALNVLLIGLMVKEMGGKQWAIFLGCLAYIISPAFLMSNSLFQPVSFNQLSWVLAAYYTIRLVKTENTRYWIALGIVAGLGFLVKYAILFFYVALIFAFLLTPHRKWFKTQYPYIALSIATLIAFPNLFWQWNHNFPIIAHMKELAETQLVHVDPIGFLFSQLLFHMWGILIWLPGLIYLLISPQAKPYRVLGWTFLFVLGLLILLSGKSYYALGVYPMLMAAGGISTARLPKNSFKIALAGGIFLMNLPIVPYGLPILPIEQLKAYVGAMKDDYGLVGPLTWEDGKIYQLPQDYADMHGWEEIAQNVAKVYHSLSPEQKATCIIYGGSYSHTSVLNYYRHHYKYPEAISLNNSHLMWAPDKVDFDNQIFVDDVWRTKSKYFHEMEFIDSIKHPYAREKGYVFHLRNPKLDVISGWQQLAQQEKAVFNF